MLRSNKLSIVMIMILLIGVILIVPSAAAAPTQIVNMSEDGDFGPGTADNFTVEQDQTSEKIQWDIKTEANGEDLLNSSSNEALHVYIDVEDGGANADTVKSERWGDFFDGLKPISADYRIRVSNVGPGGIKSVLERHDTDISYEKIADENVTVTDGGDLDQRIEFNKDSISNPDEFEYKFVYIKAPSAYDIKDHQFRWVADQTRFRDGADPVTPVTIQATANFNAGEIDTDSVEFRVENGSGVTVESTVVNPDVTNTVSSEISLAPDDVDSGSELIVEVDGDENYPFERTEKLNNSVSLGDIDDGDEFTIDFSRIKAKVIFADQRDENEVASGSFQLDNGTDAEEYTFDYDSEGSLVRNFTVNPNDFEDGEISASVESIGGEPYQFDNTQDIQFNSTAIVTFNAGQLDYKYDFNLLDEGDYNGYDDTNPDVVRDDGFKMMINLSADNALANESVQYVSHTTEFNSSILNVERVALNPASPSVYSKDLLYDSPSNETYLDDIVNEAEGEISIVAGSNTTSKNSPVANKSTPFTYNVTFEFKENLEAGRTRANNTISENNNFAISNVTLTGSDTETLTALKDDTVVPLENSETRVTEAEITHLTEGGDMVGSPMIYEVNVATNDGQLGNISLQDPNGTKIANGSFNGRSEGVIELETKDNVFDSGDNTAETDGYVETNKFNIIIEDNLDGNTSVVYSATNEAENGNLDGDILKTTIYKQYDIDASAQGSVTTEDVLAVAERVPGDGVDKLPWDTGDEVTPRADLDNTGEVTSSNLATIVGEWNQADFVEEVNATVDGETAPTIGVGNLSDLNVTVFDQRRGDTPFDADASTEGGNVTVKNIDDGGDDVTVENLSVGDTLRVTEGNASFGDVQFRNAVSGDTVDITLAVTNNIDDPDPEGTKETITVELNDPSGSLDAELNTTSTTGGADLVTALNTSYTVENAFALNVSTINVSVSDGGNGSLNLSGADGNADDLENGTIEIGDETENIEDSNVSTIGSSPVEEIGIRISEQDIEAGEKIILNTTSDVVQVNGTYNDSANITIELKNEANDVIGNTNATDQVSYNTSSP